MTEAEWLACADPRVMLEPLRQRATDRKLYLLSYACLRHIYPFGPEDENAHRAFEEAADAYNPSLEVIRAHRRFPGHRMTVGPAWELAEQVTRPRERGLRHRVPPFIRDIFGNPFRQVAFASEWRTSAAVALAARMYESRDFAAMPILADALQDAGCDSADILDHCRGPGPHVRGCWVVDLVLGKE